MELCNVVEIENRPEDEFSTQVENLSNISIVVKNLVKI